VFTAASMALSFDPFTAGRGAMWLIGWRVVQATGRSMFMANSAAILTDAFPADQRGVALGINQVAGISGQFVGLLLGGVLAAWDWRAVFWVNVPIGLFGTVWSYRSLHEIASTHRARIDWAGNVTFAVGAAALLVAITYGIQPYGGAATGWGNPWVPTRLSALPDDPITITPLRTYPVIRDLVTDVSVNYGWALHVPSFTKRDGPKPSEYRMAQADVDRSQEFRKCIECWLCQDVCHVIRDHEDNKGVYCPAGIKITDNAIIPDEGALRRSAV